MHLERARVSRRLFACKRDWHVSIGPVSTWVRRKLNCILLRCCPLLKSKNQTVQKSSSFQLFTGPRAPGAVLGDGNEDGQDYTPRDLGGPPMAPASDSQA